MLYKFIKNILIIRKYLPKFFNNIIFNKKKPHNKIPNFFEKKKNTQRISEF